MCNRGTCLCCKNGKNYKYYLCIDIIFFLLDFFVFKVDKATWFAFIITSSGVYAMECINTAIEHIADLISKEVHPEIKAIKDMAAAGVLCFGIAFFMVQIIECINYMRVSI